MSSAGRNGHIILTILSCVLFAFPSIAVCNHKEPKIDVATVDLQRLLTYPFTGEVAWGVHDTDIEERITRRFGKPYKRIPSIVEETTGESENSRDTVLEYDDMTFYLRGKTGDPNKIIMGITIKSQNAPVVSGIKLGQHISMLPIANPPKGVVVGKKYSEDATYIGEYSIHFTSYGTVVRDDGRQMPAIADCNLTVSVDDAGVITGLVWYYGTGH